MRVLPFGAGRTPAMEDQFVLFEFANGGPIVHLEHYGASNFVHDPNAMRAYVAATTTVLEAALGHRDSIALIADLADELER